MDPTLKALTFDVFGTVVDWHTGIARAVAAVLPQVEANEFAREWRAGYRPALARVEESGEWKDFGPVHRELLDEMLAEHGIADDVTTTVRDELTAAWSRLDPWPDAVDAIDRLRGSYTVATLSNGDVDLLTAMAARAGLRWDRVLGCDLFGHYKPAPEVYLGAVELLGLGPGEVMMVATHHYDLDAARSAGLQTAYVERPYEYGRDVAPEDASASSEPSLQVADMGELATRLGC